MILTKGDLNQFKGMLETLNFKDSPALLPILKDIIKAIQPYRPELSIDIPKVGLTIRPVSDHQAELPLETAGKEGVEDG